MISSLLSLLSSLFPLLSVLASLCSLPSSLLGAYPFPCHPAILGPNHCVLRPSHLDRACLSLLASRFSLLSSLFSLLSALFPLLSLLLISQIALRTCHFELCIRPSNPLPTASTLCGTLPGPAECAKRLNKIAKGGRLGLDVAAQRPATREAGTLSYREARHAGGWGLTLPTCPPRARLGL